MNIINPVELLDYLIFRLSDSVVLSSNDAKIGLDNCMDQSGWCNRILGEL